MITYQDVMFGIFIKAGSIDFQVIVMTLHCPSHMSELPHLPQICGYYLVIWECEVWKKVKHCNKYLVKVTTIAWLLQFHETLNSLVV